MRKLASVVRIASCDPIPDTDRLSVTTMEGLGWNVVTSRDEFKAGDLAVYFEIDAFLNADDERYAFLRERCLRKFVSKSGNLLDQGLRIKTVKLRGVISQGLLMPIDKFPEIAERATIAENPYDDTIRLPVEVVDGVDAPDAVVPLIGADVTKLLHVRHHDEIKEALAPVDNHAIGGDAYGSFPSVYIPKTDEPRIQSETKLFKTLKDRKFEVSVKADGCVRGDTVVTTDQGKMKINHIVEHKLKVNVLTYNEKERRCEYKPVVAWHRYPIRKPMVRIAVSKSESDEMNCRTKGVYCTSDHLFFTNRGWIEAGKLRVGDIVYQCRNGVSNFAKQMLAGCLLGDSSYSHNSVHFSHCEAQKEYLDEKARILGDLWIDSGEFTSWYGSKIFRGHTVANALVRDVVNADVSEYFTPISVAFWYMDDGSLSEAYEATNTRECMKFHAQSFSDVEVQKLCNLFRTRFGLDVSTNRCSKTGRWIIRVGTDSSDILASLIAPYVVPSMKYKLPKAYREVPYVLGSYPVPQCDQLASYHVISNEPFDPSEHFVKTGKDKGKRYWSYVFDLEVEGNHNYFGNGVLIHNSSCTMTYSPTIDSMEPNIVCSRNIRLKHESRDGVVPVMWQLAEKYKVIEALKAHYESTGLEWALQGEAVGPGIQSCRNHETEHTYKVFKIWDITNQKYVDPAARRKFCADNGIPHVDVIAEDMQVFHEFTDVESLLKFAEGKTPEGYEREGLVFKTVDDPAMSFKAVSNRYLLKLG